jgi:hypothetical protein
MVSLLEFLSYYTFKATLDVTFLAHACMYIKRCATTR